jgi:hypothetical protein
MNWTFLVMALAIPPGGQPIVTAAIADAQQRFGVQAQATQVERVTWPDMSLGCPAKGMHYPQRTVPGWRIVLSAGARTFEYHAGGTGDPVYCPAGRATPALPDTLT